MEWQALQTASVRMWIRALVLLHTHTHTHRHTHTHTHTHTTGEGMKTSMSKVIFKYSHKHTDTHLPYLPHTNLTQPTHRCYICHPLNTSELQPTPRYP